jgi:hypothetical protein
MSDTPLTSKPHADEIARHLIVLKYDVCELNQDCQPCRGIREKSIEIIERLRGELEAAEQHVKILQEQRDAEPPVETQVQRDAKRWRALIGCARIRVMGSAGLHDPQSNYAHIGVEFWTHHAAQTNPEAIETLLKFVERASVTKPASECGACDKPGEHCANVHGICSRHDGRPAKDVSYHVCGDPMAHCDADCMGRAAVETKGGL